MYFEGNVHILTVLKSPKAFAFISPDFGTTFVEMVTKLQSRGVDLIQGDLGNLKSFYIQNCSASGSLLGQLPLSYILASNHQIPTNLIRRINQLSSRIVESGLYKFYCSFAEHVARKDGNDDLNSSADTLRISIKQFEFPTIIYFILMFCSVVVFGIEIVYHKRRNRL